MGLWHGVEYFEKEKVVGEEFYQQWSNVSNFFLHAIVISDFIPDPNIATLLHGVANQTLCLCVV